MFGLKEEVYLPFPFNPFFPLSSFTNNTPTPIPRGVKYKLQHETKSSLSHFTAKSSRFRLLGDRSTYEAISSPFRNDARLTHVIKPKD